MISSKMPTVYGVMWSCALLFAVNCSSSSDPSSNTSHGGGTSAGGNGAGGNGAGLSNGGTAAGAAGNGGTSVGMGGAGGDAGSPGDAGAPSEAGMAGEAGSGAVSADVSGLVLDGVGLPIAAAPLEIGGVIVATDSKGAFTVPGVAEHYDAYVISAATKEVLIFEGLATRSPTFQFFGTADNNRTANINGRLSGGAGFPSPVGHQLQLSVGDQYNSTLPTTGVGPDYQFTGVAWFGPVTKPFTLRALQFSADAKGFPTSYDGWATKDITVTDGQTLGKTDGTTVATNLALAPITSRTVTGSITSVPECKLSADVYGPGLSLIHDTATTSPYSYVLPTSLSGTPLTMTIGCKWTTGAATGKQASFLTVGIGSSNAVNVTIRQPAALSIPVQDATGITSTSAFKWAAGEDLLTMVLFTTSDWSIRRIGLSTGTNFPDLSRFGIAFPKATVVAWDATAIGISGAKGVTEDYFPAAFGTAAPGDLVSFARSETWHFTTAP